MIGRTHRTKEELNNRFHEWKGFGHSGWSSRQQQKPRASGLGGNNVSAPPTFNLSSLCLRARFLGENAWYRQGHVPTSQPRDDGVLWQLPKNSVQCWWVGGNRSLYKNERAGSRWRGKDAGQATFSRGPLQRLSWGWTGCHGVPGSYFRSWGCVSPSVEWPYQNDLTLAA